MIKRIIAHSIVWLISFAIVFVVFDGSVIAGWAALIGYCGGMINTIIGDVMRDC